MGGMDGQLPYGEGRRPVLTRLRDVRASMVQWLWPGVLPRGKLTVITGDPCHGKSVLTCDLASRVTRGAPWPDQPGVQREPAQVLIMSAEDDASDTIRPRVEAACGDVGAMHLMTTMIGKDGRRLPIGIGDIDVLEEACKSISNLGLVILDPVSAFMGQSDSHNNTSVRGMLAPLSELGNKYGVSLVCVSHLSKSVGGKAIYRNSGSLAFVAAARCAWLIMLDPNDSQEERRLMLPIKMNIGPRPRGLAYRIRGEEVPGLGNHPIIAWEGERIDVGADQALAAEAAKLQVKGGRSVAADWLRKLLSDGPVATSTIQEEAREAGFGWALLRKLKDELGVKAVRVGFGSGASWQWALPEQGGENYEGAGIDEGALGAQASAYGAGDASMGWSDEDAVGGDVLWERLGGVDGEN